MVSKREDVERKAWDVLERALDAALAADASDTAALETGYRAAWSVLQKDVRSSYPDAVGDAFDRTVLLQPPAPIELHVDGVPSPEELDELTDALALARRRLAGEYGLIVPDAVILPDPDRTGSRIELLVRGSVVGQTDAADSGPLALRAQRLAGLLESHLAELIDREVTSELLDVAREIAPVVVRELVPNMLALGQVRLVLQNLVREQVPIKDLSTILNALADQAVYTKDPHALTEHVRMALGRKICARYQSDDGSLRAFLLSPDAERAIQNAIQLNETGQVLMLDPNTSQAIQTQLATALERFPDVLEPVVVTPPKIRRHVRALLERSFPKIVVISYSEIVAGVRIDNLQTIEAASAAVNPPVVASGGDWLLGDEDD